MAVFIHIILITGNLNIEAGMLRKELKMEYSITNNLKIYCKSMNEVFKIVYIAKSVDEANEFCSEYKKCGVIASDENNLYYVAEHKNLTIKDNILPD